jgi:Interferon-induced transmembrane protein
MSDYGSPPPPPDPNQPPSHGQEPPPYFQQPPAYGQQPPGQFGQQPSGQFGQFGQQPPAYGQQPFGQAPYGQPVGAPPSNYLVWAILSTLLCCLPLGIASIVFAAQVNSKFAAGDLAGAQEASRKAKSFAIWSAVVGLAVGVLWIVVVVAAAGSGSSTGV